MFRKLILITILFSFALPALAQNELNAFKYIIIPRKYDFLKTENQYRLNTITKHLFDEAGYQTLIKGDDYPEDVQANPCIAATAYVVNESGMLTTKVKIEINNCYNKVVFTSKQGTSKIKAYDKTYRDALEKSFVSVRELDYVYDPSLLINRPQEDKSKAAAVPVAVVAAPSAPKETANQQEIQEPVSSTTEQMQEPEVAAVETPQETTTTGFSTAKSYKNDNTSFFLIEQNNVLVAYVIDSKNENYKKGQTIGTFEKTSLANVYRVAWKKKEAGIEETTAYFDAEGNLKIDIHRDGKIEVLTFIEEK